MFLNFSDEGLAVVAKALDHYDVILRTLAMRGELSPTGREDLDKIGELIEYVEEVKAQRSRAQ